MNEKPRESPDCPVCGSDDVKAIVYGYPADETKEAADRDEIELGGCMVSPENPDWHCRSCDHAWPDPDLARPWKR